jgi:16S rRNA (guanine527-N7)-methyltransferase
VRLGRGQALRGGHGHLHHPRRGRRVPPRPPRVGRHDPYSHQALRRLSAARRLPIRSLAFDGDPLGSDDLQAYCALLAGYRRANVTGARGSPAGVGELVDDALALLEVDELTAAATAASGGLWADLGSGGGLPGIPLALALPGVRFTLIEAVGKKCVFLREAVARVGLGERVDVACARSEELAAVGRFGRERFAVVLAKAVGPLAVVVELAGPLLALGGVLAVSKTAAAASSP